MLATACQQPEEGTAAGWIEVGCRLVEHKQTRLDDQRRRQRHALKLSAGELVEAAPGQRLRTHQRQHARHARTDLAGGYAKVLEPERDLLIDPQQARLRLGVLEDDRRGGAQPRQGRLDGVEPRHADRAAHLGRDRLRDDPVEGQRERAFPRSSWAEQERGLTLADRERDVVEDRPHGAWIADRELGDLDERRPLTGLSDRSRDRWHSCQGHRWPAGHRRSPSPPRR